MLTSAPSIIKNVLIILWSSKFVSRDINGVTRIHYWRSSSFWSGMAYHASRLLSRCRLLAARRIFVPFPMEVINRDVLTYYRDLQTFYLPLRRSMFRWTMDPAGPVKTDEEKEDWDRVKDQDWVKNDANEGFEESDSRLRYELQETRAFLRRKLKEINPETFQAKLSFKSQQKFKTRH